MQNIQLGSTAKPAGNLAVRKLNEVRPAPLGWKLRNALRAGFLKGMIAKNVIVPFANFWGVATAIADLEIKVRRWHDYEIEAQHFLKLRREGFAKKAAGLFEEAEKLFAEAEAYAKTRTYFEDYGLVSHRVITNNGVGFIVDSHQNLVEMEILNYHGIGTTNTAEAAGDTALAAESTTALNPDNTRATGTQSEPASNQYRSTGTLTADGSIAAVEHGLFSQAATGGGVLFDRSVFSTINLAAADSIQTQYTVTYTAGG